jgi:hypothetical protein
MSKDRMTILPAFVKIEPDVVADDDEFGSLIVTC